MNRNLIWMLGSLFFAVGVYAGCTVGWPDGAEFSCAEDSDCSNGFFCSTTEQKCVEDEPKIEDKCTDVDLDGYGTDEVRDGCPKCKNEGLCGLDCDDSNPDVHPDAGEVCDGVDNNCDMQTDEQVPCMARLDCPNADGALAACEGGFCVYKMALQRCIDGRVPPECPCNANPLTCSGGVYTPPIPAECQ